MSQQPLPAMRRSVLGLSALLCALAARGEKCPAAALIADGASQETSLSMLQSHAGATKRTGAEDLARRSPPASANEPDATEKLIGGAQGTRRRQPESGVAFEGVPDLDKPSPGSVQEATGTVPVPTLTPVQGTHLGFWVVPEHRLLFCNIHKVGSTTFRDLINRLNNKPLSHSWYDSAPAAFNLTTADLARMLVDPSWHKAIFFRDPLERFLSAYRSKCEEHDLGEGWRCRKQFGSADVAFAEAARLMLPENRRDGMEMDMHFILQGEFCGGLSHTLQYYDTVEELTRGTSREKVERLLEKLNIEPTSVSGFDTLYPAPATEVRVSKHSHATNAGGSFYEYYDDLTVGDLRRLVEHFRPDYELFYGGALPLCGSLDPSSAQAT